MNQIVATVEFTDGNPRPVFETDDGRQYVIADTGEHVYGVWFIPEEFDRPMIIEDREAFL